MGLLSNPLGFLFGEDEKQGAVDRRVNREPEGQRWWENWENVFGEGGPMDPMSVYPKAVTALDSLMGWQGGKGVSASGGGSVPGLLSTTMANAPIKVSMDGKQFSITPRWARELPFQYASALSGLMDPWLRAGMELEQGRYGSAYRQPESYGVIGDTIGSFGKSLGGTLGKSTGTGIAKAL